MTANPRRAQFVLGIAAIMLLAASTRFPVAALSPISDRIDADIPLSALALGALGTAPPLAFALAGVLAPRLRRALGLESTMLVAMLVMLGGHVVRAWSSDYLVLLTATVVLLLGAGFGTVLLPEAVKTLTPHRIGTMTAAYAILMTVGSSVPPLIVVPLADVGSWRLSLGAWAVFSVVAVALWLVLAVRARPTQRSAAVGDSRPAEERVPRIPVRSLLRSPTVWGIGIPFAVSSICAYAGFALLPPLLREAVGVGELEAAGLLSLVGFVGVPLSGLAPLLVTRMRTPTPLLVSSSVLFGTGYLGLLVAPSALPVLWMTTIGVGFLTFPMCLTLFALRSRTPATATVVSGAVQGVGYAIAAFAPLMLGAVRDVTGSWSAPLVVLLVVSLCNLLAVPLLARRGTVDDEVAATAI